MYFGVDYQQRSPTSEKMQLLE